MGYAGYAPGHSVQELTEVLLLLAVQLYLLSSSLSLSFFLSSVISLSSFREKSVFSRHLFSKRHGPIHLTLAMNIITIIIVKTKHENRNKKRYVRWNPWSAWK
jgi:hypothetical protein